MRRTLCLLSLVVFLLSPTLSRAQTVTSDLEPEIREQIDALYEEWDDPNRPGYASFVLHDGKVVYKRTFGKERKLSETPISLQTLFNIGTLSHQQLVYGFFLLEEEGKVSLTDKLSTYLPSFSRFEEEIRLEHLLMHSSGLYDHRVLKTLLGWKPMAYITQVDLLEMINQQSKLSFSPGTDFAYSPTNIALLVEVLEKVSGQSIADFLDERVYAPLGMKNTHFVSARTWSHEHLAQSYLAEGETLAEAHVGDLSYGRGNVYSNLEDMIRWETFMLKVEGPQKETIERLSKVIQLPSGREYNMPAGKLTLGQRYINAERGMPERYITSNRAGFAASVFSFPEQGFTGLVLSNDGTPYNGYLSMETAYVLLEDEFPEPTTTDYSQLDIVNLSTEHLAIHEGFYWDALGELSREIRIVNDTLRYVRSPENSSPLVPLGKNYFQMRTPWDDKIYIQFFHSEEGSEMTYTIGEAEPIPFRKYEPLSLTDEELEKAYGGTYWNEEYGIGFQLKAEGDRLTTNTANRIPLAFQPIDSNTFSGNQWFMGSIEFSRDASSKITGFNLKNTGIRNLWFEKM
ncbi:MAG: serine hydrolase domain-containing protein [Bacteroidota bacterium]